MGQNGQLSRQERNYSVFAGGGYDVLRALWLEAQVGYAQLGTNYSAFSTTASMDALSVAARASYHYGMPIGPPTDWQRYQHDPGVFEKLLRPETYPGGFALTGLVEGIYLQQRGLISSNSTQPYVDVNAGAFAAELRIRWEELRIFARAQHRTLRFLLADQLAALRYQDFAGGATLVGQTDANLAVDYHISRARLTPGVAAGVTLPGSYTMKYFSSGWWTVIVDTEHGSSAMLPLGQEVRPIFSAKLTLRLDFEQVSAIAEGVYAHNANRYAYQETPTGAESAAKDPSVLGFHFLLQARF
ncbi:MAG: hypothetical protein QM765_00280 [Myxococcales bacterium]